MFPFSSFTPLPPLAWGVFFFRKPAKTRLMTPSCSFFPAVVQTMPGLWETKTMKEKGWALRECVAWFEKGYETPEVEGKV